MTTFESNPIGLTKYAGWSDLGTGPTLLQMLDDAKVPYESMDIHHLVGMAGCACLVFYTSPKTGLPVTVLLVPHREDIDAFSEEYFYFEGMTRAKAIESETWWLDAYDQAKELVKGKMH